MTGGPGAEIAIRPQTSRGLVEKEATSGQGETEQAAVAEPTTDQDLATQQRGAAERLPDPTRRRVALLMINPGGEERVQMPSGKPTMISVGLARSLVPPRT